MLGLIGVFGFGLISLSVAPPPIVAAGDPVIAAAGDIACDPGSSSFNGGNGSSSNCHMKGTAALLTPDLAAVLPLGDNQYYCGSLAAYLGSYNLSWGAAKAITRPAIGNHEYLTSGGTGCDATNSGAAGHFAYFGAAAGARGSGYYSYDIGAWHLIALNTNCGDAGGCSASSPQGKWLAADLAAHRNVCTVAYMHIPLFSSGGRANSNSRSFWDQLYAAGADLVLTGHDHTYERFARQTPAGVADPVKGIREFVIGTGGANHTSFTTTAANSQVRNSSTYGVLRLTLHATSYDWKFAPEAGATFTDSGSEACVGATNPPSDLTPPSVPGNVTATATGSDRISLAWTASTDDVGVTGYTIRRGGSLLATVPASPQTYLNLGLSPATQYSYTVEAFDASGKVSGQSSPPAVATTLPSGAQDLTAPSVPSNVTATATGSDRISLAWTASTDDIGVTGYTLRRGGLSLATLPASPQAYIDAGLLPGTQYSYTLEAFDASGKVSGQSSPPAVATTLPSSAQAANVTPVADSYVSAASPSSNYGTSTTIRQDGDPILRTYIRFDLSTISGTITRATLRLFPNANHSTGIEVHLGTSSTWTETGITWANAPAYNASVARTSGALVSGTWSAMDITTAVTKGIFTLVLTTSSVTQTNISSRETANSPVLVVEYTP